MSNEKKYPCKNCGKVLFFGNIIEGHISKDCPGCGERNVYKVERIVVEKFELVKKENIMNGYKKI